MLLGELIAIARRAADDLAEPSLWADDWIEFANDAQVEACRRARLITDASTASLCELTVTSGADVYALSPLIIFVRRVKLDSQDQPLKSVDHRDLDLNVPGWESQTGAPIAWVRNWETGKIRLWPTPDASDIARLRVVREPLEPMVDPNADAPEIAPRYHRGLVNWMLFRAYSKTDSQTLDPRKAAEYLALFEQEFGQKSTAVDETWINEHHGEDSFEGLF